MKLWLDHASLALHPEDKVCSLRVERREAAVLLLTPTCISAMREPLSVHLWLDPRLRENYAAPLAGDQAR